MINQEQSKALNPELVPDQFLKGSELQQARATMVESPTQISTVSLWMSMVFGGILAFPLVVLLMH